VSEIKRGDEKSVESDVFSWKKNIDLTTAWWFGTIVFPSIGNNHSN
jgi:hypothetical protein